MASPLSRRIQMSACVCWSALLCLCWGLCFEVDKMRRAVCLQGNERPRHHA